MIRRLIAWLRYFTAQIEADGAALAGNAALEQHAQARLALLRAELAPLGNPGREVPQ